MHRYVIKRLLQLIPVIIGVSFMIFFIMDLAPGTIIDMIAPDDATTEQIKELEHKYGYDRSVGYRYVLYMKNLLQGDMGVSYLTNKPVFESYMERLPYTAKLGFCAFLLSLVLSIPLGITAATHAGSIRDNVSMVLALAGLSMPNFWLGLLLIIAFALKLHWFPSFGAEDGWKSLVLPAITIGTGQMASMTRTTRSSMLDVIRSDYLRTARAKGVSENVVIKKHALRNALIPIITIAGNQLGGMFGGAVLTETVFAYPGIGRMKIDAVNQRDTNMVTGAILLTTIGISFLLLCVDLTYAMVDPRLKSMYAKKKKGGN